jgi:hypothetical protein
MCSTCVSIGSEQADDDDMDDDPPARTIVAATACDPPKTRAIRTVFELGAAPAALRLMAGVHRVENDHAARFAQALHAYGTTRCIGAAYPARWTPEDVERERRRRAKQRPPRPTRRAKTMGKRLALLAIWDD